MWRLSLDTVFPNKGFTVLLTHWAEKFAPLKNYWKRIFHWWIPSLSSPIEIALGLTITFHEIDISFYLHENVSCLWKNVFSLIKFAKLIRKTCWESFSSGKRFQYEKELKNVRNVFVCFSPFRETKNIAIEHLNYCLFFFDFFTVRSSTVYKTIFLWMHQKFTVLHNCCLSNGMLSVIPVVMTVL